MTMSFSRLTALAYTHRKRLAAIFAIYCALVVSGIVFGVLSLPPAYNESGAKGTELNSDWQIFEDGVKNTTRNTLPYSIKNPNCKVIDLYRTLPETDFRSGVLITNVYQKEWEVSLDGELLYSYRFEDQQRRNFTPGSGRFFVSLPDDFAGKELHIRYYRNITTDNSSIATILLRHSLQNPYFFIPGSDLLFIFMLSLFMAGLVLLILAIVTAGRRLLGSPLFPLSLFAMSSSLWILCNTKLIQFFTHNLVLVHNMEYISFYIMPVALWMFAWLNWHYCPKVTLPIITIMSAFFAVSITLKFLGLMDFHRLLTPFHILVFCSTVIFLSSIRTSRKLITFPLRMFFTGFGILSVCGILEIIRYYFFFSYETIFSLFVIGMLSLAVCTITSYIYTFKQQLQLQIENRMYKTLAYTDKLTGLRNRLTFEEDMERLEAEQDKYSSIIFANVDVNNFKRINDNYGHVTGDEVLQKISKELSSVCNETRKCYRLGGDEFCIVAVNNKVSDLLSMLGHINTRLYSSFVQFPVSVSFGVAEYNKFLHGTLMDVFKDSDDLMYQRKQVLHRKTSDRAHMT